MMMAKGWCAMSLTKRKLFVATAVLMVILFAKARAVTNWLADTGVIEWASAIRTEFVTGTAITIVVVLLVQLSEPSAAQCRPWQWFDRCPVCRHVRIRRGCYCSMCGCRM